MPPPATWLQHSPKALPSKSRKASSMAQKADCWFFCNFGSSEWMWATPSVKLWKSLSNRIYHLVRGLPVIILILFIFKDNLYFVTDISSYLILIITALFAINILFLIDMIIGFSEFWILYSDASIRFVFNTIISFFAGTLIPLIFLPQYIQTIGDWLPFKYAGYFIINSFIGRLNYLEILAGIGIQFIWTTILIGVVTIIWRRGLKKYEAVGL